MAELLGVVSGGAGLASLALQLGENAMQIRRFYKSYKNAPQLLEDVAFEIETFGMILDQIEHDRETEHDVDASVLDRCIQMCRHSTKRIGLVIGKLFALLQKSKIWGKLRAASDEKELLHLCGELQRATGTTTLAYQLYSVYELPTNKKTLTSLLTLDRARQKRGEENVSRIYPNETPAASDGAQMPKSEITAHRLSDKFQDQSLRPTKQKAQLRRTIHPWFTSWAWSISMRQTYSGWDLSWRTFHVIPEDSPIVRFVQDGDIEAVRLLFSLGKAFPNVCYFSQHATRSLLVGAMDFGHVGLCHMLAEFVPQTREELIGLGFTAGQDKESLFRLALSRADIELTISRSSEKLHYATEDDAWLMAASDTCWPVIRNSFAELNPGVPLQVRFDTAMVLGQYMNNFRNFMEVIGRPAIDETIATMSDRNGLTLLHLLAEMLAFEHFSAMNQVVADTLRHLRLANADFHCKDHWGRTPLQIYIREAAYYDRPLCIWAAAIQDAGIDLSRYGHAEHSIWQKLEIRAWSNRTVTGNFIHDPQPSDWDVVFQIENTVPVYAFMPPPGFWKSQSSKSLPQTICWEPADEDKTHGSYWILRRTVILSPSYVSGKFLRERDASRSLEYLKDRPQDDAGRVPRAMSRPGGHSHIRPRAHSQPCLGATESGRYYHLKTLFKGFSFGLWYGNACFYDRAWHFSDVRNSGCNPRHCMVDRKQDPPPWNSIDRAMRVESEKRLQRLELQRIREELFAQAERRE